MSPEPPSRVPPRDTFGTKSSQNELTSKGRVEKVREVDADEETRRRKKFQTMMKDSESEGEVEPNQKPYDLLSGTYKKEGAALNADSAIVPSPSYAKPPDVQNIPETTETVEGLPQSRQFWQKSDLPDDQPIGPTKIVGMEEKKAIQSITKEKGKKKGEDVTGFMGKPTPDMPMAQNQPAGKKEKPDELVGKIAPSEDEMATGSAFSGPEEMRRRFEREAAKGKSKEAFVLHEQEKLLYRIHEHKERKNKDQKYLEIEAPSLPLLPQDVQPMAFQATNTAASYLHPSTVSLFFQMVGTMYVMSAPPGIERTEILLNNPAFASSKFYRSTIIIEKYATAPDSFNIRLTGSDEAVTTFKDHLPSLMTAFQNSNVPFRIGRIDAEYAVDRPVFRRKEEKGKGRSKK